MSRFKNFVDGLMNIGVNELGDGYPPIMGFADDAANLGRDAQVVADRTGLDGLAELAKNAPDNVNYSGPPPKPATK